MQTEKRFTDKTDSTSESPTKKTKLSARTTAAMDVSGVRGGGPAAPFLLQLASTSVGNLQVHPPRSYSKSGVLHCFKDDTLDFITKRLDEHQISSMPVHARVLLSDI